MCTALAHVRFTPNSDGESGFPQTVMSALPPKADMRGATAHVCFGPEADLCSETAYVCYGPSADAVRWLGALLLASGSGDRSTFWIWRQAGCECKQLN